ncbi:hypothetical protein ABW21_db0201433 [Orbilia brochopaga]|nr:hypothetical protein ABW21_db0201433 [Drechslerella brochopaga]
MGVKTIAREPEFRFASRRWISAVCVSLSTLIIIIGFAKLLLSAAVLPDDRLESFYKSRIDTDTVIGSESVPETEIGDAKLIEKRQNSKFIVTGINWNGIQQRQNFLTFANDADLLNLFLCGLENMQSMDQNTRESYFQLAGRDLKI